MQEMKKTQEKTEKLLKNMKNEIEELIKLNNETEVEFKKIKNIVKEISEELKEFEENIESKENLNLIESGSEKDIKLKKKLTVKNTKKKSKSFSNWIFNNKEL